MNIFKLKKQREKIFNKTYVWYFPKLFPNNIINID